MAEELQREAADVAVIDTMIPAALFGAEVAGVRAVIVMHGPYMIPRADIPPLGTGLMPAKGPLGRLRDRSAAAVALAVFRSGMPALNRVRAEAGLPPVRDLPGLMARADRILVCSSPSYDFGSGSVPANVRYVGPQLDDDPREGSGEQWAGQPGQPLVLVGLSSTVMRQEGLLQRAADALGPLPVRGLVTTGPAVVSAPDNVTVTRWVRHADALPHCSAVITHGGHGTVMKALIPGRRSPGRSAGKGESAVWAPPDPWRAGEARHCRGAVHRVGDPACCGHRSGASPVWPDVTAVPGSPGRRGPRGRFPARGHRAAEAPVRAGVHRAR